MMKKTNYIEDGFTIKGQDGEDEIVLIPYNTVNILVSDKDVITMLSNFGVKLDKINHLKYFQQCFTHKSYCKSVIYPDVILESAKKELGNPLNLLELRDESYERLEFLGDKVLKLIVSFYLFNRYPSEDEGFMTRLQTKLEDKRNLSIFSKEIKLNKFFIISKQVEMMNGRNLENINEDVFESFIGALFLSNGIEPCLFLITNLLENFIDYGEKLYCDNNYKDFLLRVFHQKKWKTAKYINIAVELNEITHKKKYIMGIEKQEFSPTDTLIERCISYGIGYSKKEGEQNAAKMALILLGELKEDQYNKETDLYYPDTVKYEQDQQVINPNDKNKQNILNYMNNILDFVKKSNKKKTIQTALKLLDLLKDDFEELESDTISIYSDKSI